jgi:hypothetical protein
MNGMDLLLTQSFIKDLILAKDDKTLPTWMAEIIVDCLEEKRAHLESQTKKQAALLREKDVTE